MNELRVDNVQSTGERTILCSIHRFCTPFEFRGQLHEGDTWGNTQLLCIQNICLEEPATREEYLTMHGAHLEPFLDEERVHYFYWASAKD